MPQLEARRDVSQVAQLVAWADGRDVSYGPSAVAQCLHFEPAAGGDGEVPPRRRLQWLLSFLCGEPSDFAFDALSGILEEHDTDAEAQ